jgi:hypothetical protein
MLPTKNNSEEMGVVYFISIIPEVIKELTVYAIIGFFILSYLYYSSRLYLKASIIFATDALIITGKNFNRTIKFDSIKGIWCDDLTNYSGESKEKLQIVLREKGGKEITFFLKYYVLSDDFMQTLTNTVKDVRYSFYNNESVGEDDG